MLTVAGHSFKIQGSSPASGELLGHVCHCQGPAWCRLTGAQMSQPTALLVQADNGRATEETCTQYNMLKLARYLFTWTGDVAFADYYERAILNGILGTQRTPHEHSHNELSGHSHSHGHFHGHGHDNGDQHAAPDVISVEQDKLSATSRCGAEDCRLSAYRKLGCLSRQERNVLGLALVFVAG